MYPVLFEIGSFKVQAYGVMLIVAFFVGVFMMRKRAARYGFTPDEVSDASFWTLIFGVLGARIVFILLSLDYYLKPENLDEIYSLHFEGLTSFGGLLFGFLYMLIWAKRKGKSAVAFFDMMSGPLLIAHAIGRVGCLLNGCCHGPICDPGQPFCVHIDSKNPNFYQPAQIYDSAMCVVAYFLLVWLEKRGLVKGQSLSLFLILYGLSRFVYEFWRAGVSSEVLGPIPLTLAHLTAAGMMVVGIGLYFWYGSKHKSQPEVPA